MPNALQQAGALSEPSNFAPLHTNRIFTGLWTNRSPLRDAATSDYQEHYGMGRQDSILAGQNTEITPRLTLARRPGSTVYNSNVIAPVKRFYSFNTFTLTDEVIRVMADTATQVLDVTNNGNTVIWNKSAGADPRLGTFFLGVGNTLYMTNGVDNIQYLYPSGQTFPWGLPDPTVPPNVSVPTWAGYGQWAPSTVLQRNGAYGGVNFIDPNGNVQYASTYGRTGNTPPATWLPNQGDHTQDGTVSWQNRGNGQWQANHAYGFGNVVILYATASDGNTYFFQNEGSGVTGATVPNWLPGLNTLTPDNGYQWRNIGRVFYYADIGSNTTVGGQPVILDNNGGVQQVLQAGKTGTTQPNFAQIKTALTSDPDGRPQGAVLWQNIGSIGAVQWGYAWMNSRTKDISNMSPPSLTISTSDGELVNVTGPGIDPATGADTIIIYHTAHGGSKFLYAGQVANPGAGQQWQFDDNIPDADLNTEWQAQRGGEGTPLPAGATCLGYHLTRIFAAVGNVVWISSGPDATVGGSSGNAGFDTTFTCQSKITRFWTCSLGMVVFTVRDAYIILGSATDQDPLYMVVFIEDLPLRSYDCFTVNKTTPYILDGTSTLLALDPSSGITEIGFPIADLLESEFDTAASYVTFHKQTSRDTALYVANGIDHWYRMSATNAPENGSAWSPRATFPSLGCVQSVEVSPGQYRLLMSGTSPGPILQRDGTRHNDNGILYPAWTQFGSIVLAQPGQMAALFFITLESQRVGTRASLALLLGEVKEVLTGPNPVQFETLKRTRQDPVNLPPSATLFSDRYHFGQSQECAWCRHFQMRISWPAEDAANELLTFTIFGQTWQEMRAQ